MCFEVSSSLLDICSLCLGFGSGFLLKLSSKWSSCEGENWVLGFLVPPPFSWLLSDLSDRGECTDTAFGT